mgnify:CR=1 FL=1
MPYKKLREFGIPDCYSYLLVRELPRRYKKQVDNFISVWEVPDAYVYAIYHAWLDARREWKRKRGQVKFLDILKKHAKKVRSLKRLYEGEKAEENIKRLLERGKQENLA